MFSSWSRGAGCSAQPLGRRISSPQVSCSTFHQQISKHITKETGAGSTELPWFLVQSAGITSLRFPAWCIQLLAQGGETSGGARLDLNYSRPPASPMPRYVSVGSFPSTNQCRQTNPPAPDAQSPRTKERGYGNPTSTSPAAPARWQPILAFSSAWSQLSVEAEQLFPPGGRKELACTTASCEPGPA